MTEPPIWTREQLEIDRDKAITIFRNERMESRSRITSRPSTNIRAHIEELLETTVDLSNWKAQPSMF